jgi:hypothetical protein
MADGDREVELREALFDAVSVREGAKAAWASEAQQVKVSFPPVRGRTGLTAATDVDGPGDEPIAEQLVFDAGEHADDEPHAVTRR